MLLRILISCLAMSLAFAAAASRSCSKAQSEADKMALQLHDARESARLCAEAREALAQEIVEREAAAAKALESARTTAQKAAARADYELSRAAAVPGDDCASAKARAESWLLSRGAK